MAEARQVAGLKLAVKPDGKIEIDWSSAEAALWLIFNSGARSLKRKWAISTNAFKTLVYPFQLEVIAAMIILLTVVHMAGLDVTFGYTQRIISALCMMITDGRAQCGLWMFSCVSSAIVSTTVLVFSIRRTLKLLLTYQGWMFMSREELKKPPLYFKIWALWVHSLSSLSTFGRKSTNTGKAMLYSYQGALPSLPVPPLKKTLERHLRTMRPLLNDEEYDNLVKLTAEFETSLAPRLQRYLWLKWIWSDNYVSDWWEEYVYLSSRSPLMINSNFYGLDCICNDEPVFKQASRAANLIYLCFNFRRILIRQQPEPLMIQRIVPMCSAQYERMFNTTRIPGKKVDKLFHLEDSTHIAVIHKGKFYRFGCYSNGQLLNPAELQMKIQYILDDETEVKDDSEMKLAVLTASERTTWANQRETTFSNGKNKASLEAIESAAFVAVLDDYVYDYDEKDSSKLNHYAKSMLHGNGYNRWFDKSLTIIIGRNGRAGLNVEHSWADAPITGHLMQYCQTMEYSTHGYNIHGDCKGKIRSNPSMPTLLQWNLNDECRETIASCIKIAEKSIDDLQLHILIHDNFGKGAIKKCRNSPDAFVQMALQLAYYRDNNKRFSLTYEASTTRLFRDGRTETIRPCTIESSAYVKAMNDSTKSKQEKVVLLKQACEQHTKLTQEAMTGQGIDRHLFCLYVISKYLEIDSPFLTKVLKEPWRLSTSQTATRPEYNELGPDLDTVIACGGGFGPVVDDGYGVSYFMIGENKIFFHISSSKKAAHTDPSKFASEIEKAMEEMRSLFS